MKNKKDIFRLYLKFGNRETWKRYLKNTVISSEYDMKDSLWTLYGEYARATYYMDEPPVVSLERLDCGIIFVLSEKKATTMVKDIVDLLNENVILMAEFCAESGEKVRYCYLGDKLHTIHQKGNVKLAKMYDNFEEDDNSKSYMERWLMTVKELELNEYEREFYRKIEEQELEAFLFGKSIVENRLSVKFTNTRSNMVRNLIKDMNYNDDLSFFSLMNRIEAAVVDKNTIDFSDLCLIPTLARRISLLVAGEVFGKKTCAAEIEFKGVKKSDKRKSFHMIIDKKSDVMDVIIDSTDDSGKHVMNKYTYKYGAVTFDELYEDIMGIEYTDDMNVYDEIEKALQLI